MELKDYEVSSPSLPQKTPLIWSDTTENLLVSWCDIARSYNWLHDKSYRKYNKLNYYFSIPIIVLSTLTGTANIGINSYVSSADLSYAQLGIGCVNILTGIITTLQNFFRYAQNSQSHLNAATGWSKLYRNIKIELSLERDKRRNANDFVKISRAEYDRLMEQSPVIPSDIIYNFKKILYDKNMVLPDIVDTIKHTNIYDPNISTEKNAKQNIHNFLKQTLKSSSKNINDPSFKEDSKKFNNSNIPRASSRVNIEIPNLKVKELRNLFENRIIQNNPPEEEKGDKKILTFLQNINKNSNSENAPVIKEEVNVIEQVNNNNTIPIPSPETIVSPPLINDNKQNNPDPQVVVVHNS